MSRKLFDEDGTEIEVPTQEELDELNKKAEASGKTEELEKLVSEVRESLELKEEDDILEAVKLSKDSSNPNWKAARDKISRLTTFIEENNKDAKIEEDGSVKTDAPFDQAALEKKLESNMEQKFNDREIKQRLSKYPEDKREVMEAQFKKQSSGEELNSESMDKFMGEAETIVFPRGVSTPSMDGGAPNIATENKDDFSNTEKGQALAEGMDLPFSKVDKDGKEKK